MTQTSPGQQSGTVSVNTEFFCHCIVFILTCICICGDIRDNLYNDPVDCEEVTKCVPVSGHARGFVSATSASCFVFAKNFEPPPVSCLVLATPMNEVTSVTPSQQRHYTGIALFRNERKFLPLLEPRDNTYDYQCHSLASQ